MVSWCITDSGGQSKLKAALYSFFLLLLIQATFHDVFNTTFCLRRPTSYSVNPAERNLSLKIQSENLTALEIAQTAIRKWGCIIFEK